MFRLLYRLLSAQWFRRVLLLVFGTGLKLVRVVVPEAATASVDTTETDGSDARSGLQRALFVLRSAAREASDDDLTLMASSMAFYVMLALGPLMAIVLGIAHLISPLARSALLDQAKEALGAAPAQLIGSVVESGSLAHESGLVALTLGALVLFFNIAGVFAGMQAALNRIWKVQAKPQRSLGHWLGKRLLSLLLLIIMAICVALAAVSGPLLHRLVDHHFLASLLSFLASFVMLTFIFALILQYLPDVNIPWGLVWSGAIATSLLFLAGRSLISLYLLHAGVATAYGATASFVVLMLAVFYNSLIIFIGAEVTQVQAQLTGVPLTVEQHAAPSAHGVVPMGALLQEPPPGSEGSG